MNRLKLIIFSLLWIAQTTLPSDVNTVFIDVNVLFRANTMRASDYIGKIDALRYLAKVGSLPSQKQLFQQLQAAPSQQNLITYSKNLQLPAVLGDWLINALPWKILLKQIEQYLEKLKLSSIEKKIYTSIVTMMLTPSKLADTQEVIPNAEQLLNEFKAQKFNIYLVGNWAHLASLVKEFPTLFAKLNGAFTSEQLKCLKPYQEFYQKVIDLSQTTPESCIWIESEDQFVKQARSYGYKVAKFDTKNKQYVYQDLQQLHIHLA